MSTQTKTIAIYATETMADWEYAYLTAEVTRAEQLRPGRFQAVFVGDGTAPVRSLGGLTITPTVDLDELAEMPGLAALVIPGADTYGPDTGASPHEQLLAILPRLLDAGTPVAAICGATLLLARGGFLDDRRHTSNAKIVLEMSGYAGAEHYVEAPVVTDRGITTGSGVHPVEFTAEIFRLTGLVPDEITTPWEQLYLTGRPEAFYALMAAQGAFANS
ncbi:MAG: DJ-1/PfpI family protein [Tetrasphaera sp.]